MLNLNATNAGIAVVIGLFTSAKIGNTETALIIAASVLPGLFVRQSFWASLITTTTYENIAANDFRIRTKKQATMLLGLDSSYLKLFLAMLSPLQDVFAHGGYNSYLDATGPGILEMSKPAPTEIIYLVGYITGSLDANEISSQNNFQEKANPRQEQLAQDDFDGNNRSGTASTSATYAAES